MADPFMDALRRYFADKLGEDPGELHIQIYYDEGYHYSEYTNEDPSFKVYVYRTTTDEYGGNVIDHRSPALVSEYDNGAGEFLQELFNWQDGMFAAQRAREELRAEAARQQAERERERVEKERQRRSAELWGHPAWD